MTLHTSPSADIDRRLQSLDGDKALRLLCSAKGRDKATSNTDLALSAYNSQKHKINDRSYRRDKYVTLDAPEEDDMSSVSGSEYYFREAEDGTRQIVRIERVNRIALALQKLIVSSSVTFALGNPVAYHATARDEKEERVYQALKEILRENKSTSHDRKMARQLFAFAEVAELWYPVASDAPERYGLKTKFKLRCQILSPSRGDQLSPYFDEYGDMVAFTRLYTREDEDGEKHQYADSYTAHWQYRWIDSAVAEGFPIANTLGKIPIIYMSQEAHESAEVDHLIDRLELLLSNFSDTNDYHASPKIFVTGELRGFSRRGEAGGIIEGDTDSRAEYLSWSSAPEAVKLEIETLLKMIYSLSQTPDLSFESLKGLGAISGVALKLLFMDAQSKVQDKREILDEFFARRVSLLKAYIGQMELSLSASAQALAVEPEITPYIITSDSDELNYWLLASGNKPLISHEEAVQKAGLSQDPEGTLERLRRESEAESQRYLIEPTGI